MLKIDVHKQTGHLACDGGRRALLVIFLYLALGLVVAGCGSEAVTVAPTAAAMGSDAAEALPTQTPQVETPTPEASPTSQPTATPSPTATPAPQEGDTRILEDGTAQTFQTGSWITPEDGEVNVDGTMVWDAPAANWRSPQEGDVYTNAEGQQFSFDAGSGEWVEVFDLDSATEVLSTSGRLTVRLDRDWDHEGPLGPVAISSPEAVERWWEFFRWGASSREVSLGQWLALPDDDPLKQGQGTVIAGGILDSDGDGRNDLEEKPVALAEMSVELVLLTNDKKEAVAGPHDEKVTFMDSGQRVVVEVDGNTMRVSVIFAGTNNFVLADQSTFTALDKVVSGRGVLEEYLATGEIPGRLNLAREMIDSPSFYTAYDRDYINRDNYFIDFD